MAVPLCISMGLSVHSGQFTSNRLASGHHMLPIADWLLFKT